MLKYTKIVFFSVQILLLSNLISFKDQKSNLKTFVIKTRSKLGQFVVNKLESIERLKQIRIHRKYVQKPM